MSPRYDTAPDEYFDWSQPAQTPEEKKEFTLSIAQLSNKKFIKKAPNSRGPSSAN